MPHRLTERTSNRQHHRTAYSSEKVGSIYQPFLPDRQKYDFVLPLFRKLASTSYWPQSMGVLFSTELTRPPIAFCARMNLPEASCRVSLLIKHLYYPLTLPSPAEGESK